MLKYLLYHTQHSLWVKEQTSFQHISNTNQSLYVCMTVFTHWKYCSHVVKRTVCTTSITDWVVIIFWGTVFLSCMCVPRQRVSHICDSWKFSSFNQNLSSKDLWGLKSMLYYGNKSGMASHLHTSLAFPYCNIETCTKRSSGIFVLLLLLEWNQWEGGGKVNYDLWLPVLHCVTSVGSWSPNLSIGSALTWSAQWQESNTQTDLIWQRETRADLALLSYRVWPRGHHGNSWEASSGMKQQQRFTDIWPPLKLDLE